MAAQPNFELVNDTFALSPMVLRAKTDPSKSMTLTVKDRTGTATVQITLTADVNGEVVYDVAPVVRSIIAAKFRRENIKVGRSPYGAGFTFKLDNTYSRHSNVIWARKSYALIEAIGDTDDDYYGAWLLPSGKYTYNPNKPFAELLTTTSADFDGTLYAKNKRTGTVTELADPYMYEEVYNNSSALFGSLPVGNYEVYMDKPGQVSLDLTVTDGCFPTDALKEGKQVYIRYCNQWGGISYALLQSTQRSTKNKNTYVQKNCALDAAIGDEWLYSVYPDRVMTGQEITTTFKAGKDNLTSEELRELQAILVSPMVDRYDVDTDEWVPVYPSDNTVNETNDALHEITIEFEENTEGF